MGGTIDAMDEERGVFDYDGFRLPPNGLEISARVPVETAGKEFTRGFVGDLRAVGHPDAVARENDHLIIDKKWSVILAHIGPV